ncbi:hypothetical protein [Sphaerisporangium corydalis]|uniref:Uncharacterized protein n=1 Tax=Sphaerisporangium corydalis TaxID=1441875 RepID=A0ABV9EB12_9ACTN|nr:hypothetical protein [Sphaerisporangium corydalis]
MRGSKTAVVLVAAAALMAPMRAEAGTAAPGAGTATAARTAVAPTGAAEGRAFGPGQVAGTLRAPSGVAKRLFRAWLRHDRRAAAAVATPAAVRTLFSYAYRAPDRFAGCAGNACRFVHTSVRVPGGLNGILMVVSHGTVARVYESRHITTPAKAAKYLYDAWRAGDRNRGLEIAATGVVTKLFRVKFGGPGYLFQGCQAEKGGRSCAYSYEGGAMFLHLRGGAARGYEVRSISYIAD